MDVAEEIGLGEEGCTRCGHAPGVNYLPHDDPSEFVCHGCIRDTDNL